MWIDENLVLPEKPGKILVIKSKSIDKKAEAFITLMRLLKDTEALIFIPHIDLFQIFRTGHSLQ